MHIDTDSYVANRYVYWYVCKIYWNTIWAERLTGKASELIFLMTKRVENKKGGGLSLMAPSENHQMWPDLRLPTFHAQL